MSCPLCKRDVPPTRHHVRLRRRSRRVVEICRECQQVVHGLYPGTEIASRPDLWTVEGLAADPRIAAGVAYVARRAPGETVRMRQRRRR